MNLPFSLDHTETVVAFDWLLGAVIPLVVVGVVVEAGSAASVALLDCAAWRFLGRGMAGSFEVAVEMAKMAYWMQWSLVYRML